MTKSQILLASKRIVAAMIVALAALIAASLFNPAEAIEQDKVLHLSGSAAIAYGINDSFKESDHPIAYPFALTLSLGLLKEMAVDMEVDRNDLAADAVGAFLGIAMANQHLILPSWNTTDKYLLESYLVMSAIDVWQTRKALSIGYSEGNTRTYGSHPSINKLWITHATAGYLIYTLADTYSDSRTTGLVAVNILQFLVVRHNYFIIGF